MCETGGTVGIHRWAALHCFWDISKYCLEKLAVVLGTPSKGDLYSIIRGLMDKLLADLGQDGIDAKMLLRG